jgi:hypothetical protein
MRLRPHSSLARNLRFLVVASAACRRAPPPYADLAQRPCDGFRQQGRTNPLGWRLDPCLGMEPTPAALALAITPQSRGVSLQPTPGADELSPCGAHAVCGGPSYSVVGSGSSLDGPLPGPVLGEVLPHFSQSEGSWPSLVAGLHVLGGAVRRRCGATTPQRPRGRLGCRS